MTTPQIKNFDLPQRLFLVRELALPPQVERPLPPDRVREAASCPSGLVVPRRARFAPLRFLFSETHHSRDLIIPPPDWSGGIFSLVFYRMEELSGDYKYILILAESWPTPPPRGLPNK